VRQQEDRFLVFCQYSSVQFHGFAHHTHDIGLGADGNQSVDVLADRYKDLSSHVTTLLRSWRLILNVNTSSTLLDKKHGELHDRSQTSVSSVGIGNDWSEKVGVSDLRAVRLWCCETLFTLLSVVEQLGHEKMANLVRYGSLRSLATIHGSNLLESLRRGNQPDLDQARRSKKLLTKLAIRKHIRCQGILPSGLP
jgi:hypothetical protein